MYVYVCPCITVWFRDSERVVMILYWCIVGDSSIILCWLFIIGLCCSELFDLLCSKSKLLEFMELVFDFCHPAVICLAHLVPKHNYLLKLSICFLLSTLVMPLSATQIPAAVGYCLFAFVVFLCFSKGKDILQTMAITLTSYHYFSFAS